LNIVLKSICTRIVVVVS